MTLPDEHAEALVREIMEATGKPEGEVRAVCAGLANGGLKDRAAQLDLIQTWGWGWAEMEAVMALGAPDIRAIGQGIAARSMSIVSVLQKSLADRLPGEIGTMPLKDVSTIAKQQSDLARSWLGDPQQPSQHVHFHGSEAYAGVRFHKAQREAEKPAAERLRERGITLP